MRVLITGVAGLLGSRLADWLADNTSHDIIGVDDLSGGYIDNVNRKVQFHQFDLADNSKLEKLFEATNPDIVYHFAAYAAEGLSPFMRSFNYKNNLMSTSKVINACINYKRSLLMGDFNMISELMETYWRMKLETNPHVASPEILDSYDYARKNGATAAKISGAGGGGHMVLFTEFEERHRLISALKNKEGRVVPFKFVNHGVDVWRQ